jgi:hypothetical protein
MKNPIIITVIVASITAGAGFFGGMQYQKSKTPAFSGRIGNSQFGSSQGLNRGMGSGNGQMRNGFRPVSGEISAVDDRSITVKMDDGSSKIVILSEKTEINKADTATKAELTTGTRVAVFGTQNSDGSVTASNIQLNPRQFAGPTPTPVK